MRSLVVAAVLGGLAVAGAPRIAASGEGDRGAAGAEGVPLGHVVDVSTVQLYPVVRHGRKYVRDLESDDFVVLDDGEPAVVDTFASEVADLRVTLLIDLSESMRKDLERVQRAAGAFIDSIDPRDAVAVYGFSDRLVSAPTDPHDHAAAKEAIDDLGVVGGTRIYDALDEVLDAIDATDQRNVIVLFTDGADGSARGPRASADRAIRKGVIVYPISSRGPSQNLRARRDMKVLASWTGGQAHYLVGLRRLGGVFDAILADLHAQYALSFTPRSGPPGERRIEVEVRDERYEVRARTSYFY